MALEIYAVTEDMEPKLEELENNCRSNKGSQVDGEGHEAEPRDSEDRAITKLPEDDDKNVCMESLYSGSLEAPSPPRSSTCSSCSCGLKDKIPPREEYVNEYLEPRGRTRFRDQYYCKDNSESPPRSFRRGLFHNAGHSQPDFFRDTPPPLREGKYLYSSSSPKGRSLPDGFPSRSLGNHGFGQRPVSHRAAQKIDRLPLKKESPNLSRKPFRFNGPPFVQMSHSSQSLNPTPLGPPNPVMPQRDRKNLRHRKQKRAHTRILNSWSDSETDCSFSSDLSKVERRVPLRNRGMPKKLPRKRSGPQKQKTSRSLGLLDPATHTKNNYLSPSGGAQPEIEVRVGFSGPQGNFQPHMAENYVPSNISGNLRRIIYEFGPYDAQPNMRQVDEGGAELNMQSHIEPAQHNSAQGDKSQCGKEAASGLCCACSQLLEGKSCLMFVEPRNAKNKTFGDVCGNISVGNFIGIAGFASVAIGITARMVSRLLVK
ncbi:hypothetical protein CIHG_08859 [Coccidioides immitis H538.4]|uniref:Uncharacterized protein n=1 Tax=Coccidioides immitis H538.4 TaxID=396776 RepID=A0A0J8S3S3_COCIT|nr:hypothetical protein CIHG_08859 [Coccidioides immitis H538.4]